MLSKIFDKLKSPGFSSIYRLGNAGGKSIVVAGIIMIQKPAKSKCIQSSFDDVNLLLAK